MKLKNVMLDLFNTAKNEVRVHLFEARFGVNLNQLLFLFLRVSITVYTIEKSLAPLSHLDPPDTFLYVTIGLIALSALLFVDSTSLFITNLKRSSLPLFNIFPTNQ